MRVYYFQFIQEPTTPAAAAPPRGRAGRSPDRLHCKPVPVAPLHQHGHGQNAGE